MALVQDGDESLFEQRLAFDGQAIVDVAQDADVDRALTQRVVLLSGDDVEAFD